MELHHAMEVEELKALVYDGQQKYSQLQTESSLNYSALLEENKRILDDYARLKDRFERFVFHINSQNSINFKSFNNFNLFDTC